MQKGRPFELEPLLTRPEGFGLATASPLQRAICRVADGLPLGDLWGRPEVQSAFGGTRPPEVLPAMMVVASAIRSAKTTIAAVKVVAASQSCDLTGVSPGDEVRIPVLSVDKDTAGAAFNHIRGMVEARPALRALVIGEPTSDSITFRHPSGKPVEVKVTAVARAGSTLVGRWLATAVFDEAPRMVGGDDGVRNLDDSINAIQGRMLPGSQIWLVGSPWAPFGPIYDMFIEHFGRPSADICYVKAPGFSMNPVYWTPQKCDELKKRNPQAYRTDVLAEFADPESSLFSSIEVEAAQRRSPAELPPEEPESGVQYIAAMDPATRGNAWTLVIVGCYGFGGPGGTQPLYKVAVARQWIGSKSAPLSPHLVLQEIAAICGRYGLDSAFTDQYSLDAMRDLASLSEFNLTGITFSQSNRLKMVESCSLLVSTECLELPPDRQLRQDLLAARRRVTQNGVTLVLPKTGDGRHCDYVPALALAMAHPPGPPEPQVSAQRHGFEDVLDRLNRTGDIWEDRLNRFCS